MDNLKEVAKIIYEATRLEAQWSRRKIVPEKFEKRSKAFQEQFISIIKKYLYLSELPTPEEAHNSWMRSYKKMGWKYGKERDPKKKLHPDMIPFCDLPQDERDKDAIFLTIVWAIKNILKLHNGEDL